MVESSSPVDSEAYRLMRAGRLREALPLAERAVAGASVCLPGHSFLASLLLQLGHRRDADRVVTEAAALPMGAAEAYDGLAYVSLALDQHERANAFYKRATELAPRLPHYWYNLACSERSLGKLVEAEAACAQCIALDPTQYRTYLLRSELRVQSVESNHVGELEAQLVRPDLSSAARVFLGYAIGKELDDLGRFDAAFAWFRSAAQARRAQLRYDVADDERKLRRLAEVFPDVAPGGHKSGSRCLFIVGLPRSGTTLLERILSGLPGVRSNGETENFAHALSRACAVSEAQGRPQPRVGSGSADVFERAAAADPERVASHYLRAARVGDDVVIEKLPTNYLYLGAIQRALPDAKILWVTRSPIDSCFAMYRTLFGDAYPFTYDFDELARYYAAYRGLMSHWQRVLGDSLYPVVYEELVREPQRIGALVAQHCELAWTPAAIDIQANKSVSLTASAAQIRKPIYGSSTGRWRSYREHLAPLILALRKHGVPILDDASSV